MHLQFHSIPNPATTTRPFLVPIPIKTNPKITHPIDLQYNPIRKQHKLSSSRLVVLASSSAASPSSSSNNNNALWWESLLPPTTITKTPSLSDILWPSAGAFVAMAVLGKIDEFLAPKGVSLTIAPLGAVCAVLFAAPSSPAAQKYNMFVAQIGCAAIGVLAFTLLGPGWLARSASLAASIAFMIYTRSTHPPAASLPLLFIDGAKLHHLNLWYAVFPGATACVILCLLQQVVYYLNIEMIGADQIINPFWPSLNIPSNSSDEGNGLLDNRTPAFLGWPDYS